MNPKQDIADYVVKLRAIADDYEKRAEGYRDKADSHVNDDSPINFMVAHEAAIKIEARAKQLRRVIDDLIDLEMRW